MSPNNDVPARASSTALEAAQSALGMGRLGTYSMLGAMCASLPVPFLPGSLATRVRGALVQDVCARHALSITPEARHVLSKPGLAEGPEGIVGAAVRFATTQVLSRLGPLTVLPPLRSGLLTFAIGHLLSRYLSTRESRSIRVDVEEALRVRRAIERAITLVVSTPAHAERDTSTSPEELRDQLTQLTDSLIAGLASMPGHVVRRLEAAFDAQMQQT